MNKARAILAAGLVLAIGLATAACDDADDDQNPDATPAPAEVQLTQENDGDSVTLAADGTLIVALPSNPSTGYSWAIVSPEPEFLELDGQPSFVPAGSTTPVVGAGGTEVFTLKATGAGTSELRMEYNRTTTPPEEPEETFTVTVETR